jgi:hypothetical protein
VQFTAWARDLRVTGDGTGVVSHAGTVLLRLLADRVGLTGALSTAMARRGFHPVHDRGRVLTDVAVMIADGGEAIADIEVLRDQGEVLGPVPATATVWRALDAVDTAALHKIARARAVVRKQVWARLPALPASRAGGQPIDGVVLDVDATLVLAHSEKEGAAATYKSTFGFHPIGVWCDNTGENLALKLRPGNAGANDASDHLQVLGEAFAQVPAGHRRRILVRSDSAGASHKVVAWLAARTTPRRRVEYSIGWRIDDDERAAISGLPETAWSPAVDADGDIRDGAFVAELTGLLALSGWPADMRVIVRRERPHPGAQLDLFETRDGWRYTAFITNTRVGALQWLEVRHRAHARVEDRVRCGKDIGLRRLPSREFAINAAWCLAAAIACDLIAWLQLLALTGELARAEPKTLRYRILHAAARLTRGQRRRWLRVPATWPWVNAIVDAFTTIAAIPASG